MSLPPRRPRRLRIDPLRCQHGGLCRLVAPEIGDPTSIPVTAATLGAMGECPSGALRWHEDAPEERDR